jgi:hypothetical protein
VPFDSATGLTLVATILGSSIAILDSSVVSVALPSIQRGRGGGLAGRQWVSNAYLIMKMSPKDPPGSAESSRLGSAALV